MHFVQCRYAQNGTYTLKDSPHPQRSVSLGLLNTKEDENSSSLKSIVVPNKYITADFLKQGNVFTDDQIDAYIALKFEEIHNFEHTPHPIEFDMYYSC